MPKRRCENKDSDEYIRRKMKKIEKELRRRNKRSRRTDSETDASDAAMTPVSLEPDFDQESLVVEEVDLMESQPQINSILVSELNKQTEQSSETPRLLGTAGSQEPGSVPASEEKELNEEILLLLGSTPCKDKKFGPKIQKDIALRWEHIATNGLTKEARKELLERHPVPENCQKLNAPLLNPEIKAALNDTLIGKDKGLQLKRQQLASAIACLGEAMTTIVNTNVKDTNIIKPLLEAAQIMCDAQFAESMKRRSLICASIKKDIKAQLYETEMDSYLFGEKLAETLKAAKAIHTSGAELRTVSRPPLRNLNVRPQLANSRQPAKRALQQPAAQPRTAAPVQRRRRPPAPPPLPPPPPPPSLPLPRSQQRPYQHR